jgi:hypothetical protein
MKKINLITKALLAIILVLSIKMTGCEQEDLDAYIDCDFCLEAVPDSADLIVTVTIDEENPYVPLTFYKGDYEHGVVDYRDTASTEELFLYSEVGTDYAVMATYQQDGETIFVVDGDRMRVVNGEGDCYPPCYYIRGGTLDLRLK